MKLTIFELGIFLFNSYVYYLTRGFIASTRAFILLTRTFNLPTRVLCLATRAFSLLTREFELVIRVLLFIVRKEILTPPPSHHFKIIPPLLGYPPFLKIPYSPHLTGKSVIPSFLY